MTTYSIGYQHYRDLLGLHARGGSESTRAAIERLYRREGSRQDVETCAYLYEAAGEGANAAELRRECYAG